MTPDRTDPEVYERLSRLETLAEQQAAVLTEVRGDVKRLLETRAFARGAARAGALVAGLVATIVSVVIGLVTGWRQ